MKRPRQSYIWILAAATVELLHSSPSAALTSSEPLPPRLPSPQPSIRSKTIVRNLASEETDARLIVTIGHGLDDWAAQAAQAS